MKLVKQRLFPIGAAVSVLALLTLMGLPSLAMDVSKKVASLNAPAVVQHQHNYYPAPPMAALANQFQGVRSY